MNLRDGFTLIVPYYRNVDMLRRQLANWAYYDPAIRIVLVDDGSPESAESVIKEVGFSWATFEGRLSIYRIKKDIPWNRGGARNLGATVCETQWLMHMDIDHVLPIQCSNKLLESDKIKPTHWYRFPRYRIGAADETRKKDLIPSKATFGQIKPHIDSYLCTKNLYWLVGGYDEDYSGCLGGGSPFLKQLEAAAPVSLLPGEISLHVYTRDICADASDFSLSRDTEEYTRRRQLKEKIGRTKAIKPLRFEWERVL